MLEILVAVCTAGVVSWLGARQMIVYARRHRMLDVPNARSSHVAPTPRGGGLAMAVVVLAGIVMLTARGDLPAGEGAALMCSAAVALVGWLDDRRGVRPRWRLLVQGSAALAVVVLLGAPNVLHLGAVAVPLGPFGGALTVCALVWLTNLFNFMDGIDGLAAAEAAMVAGVGGVLLLLAGATGPATVALVLSATAFGFLVVNWQPARIFMGDVGSGFTGFVLGTLALLGHQRQWVPLEAWLILLGVFLFDATVTLARRVSRESIYEAHRRHAYQRAVQWGSSHARVTAGVLAINMVLAVLALAATAVPGWTLLWLAGALLVVLLPYLWVEARQPMWADRSPHAPSPARCAGAPDDLTGTARSANRTGLQRPRRRTLDSS